MGNTPRDRTGLRVREGEHISFSGILGILRQVMCTAIALVQGSEGVNPLRTEAAKIVGSSGGSKRWKCCGDVVGPVKFLRGGNLYDWLTDEWWLTG